MQDDVDVDLLFGLGEVDHHNFDGVAVDHGVGQLGGHMLHDQISKRIVVLIKKFEDDFTGFWMAF